MGGISCVWPVMAFSLTAVAAHGIDLMVGTSQFDRGRVAAAEHGIDPDVDRVLKAAPPPGDYNGGNVKRLPVNPLTVLEYAYSDSSVRTATYQVQSKLLHLKIPRLVFNDASGRSAFQWLAEQSVALDPKHEGVIFVFDPGVHTKAFADRLLDQTVSLSHSDVPFDEAIRYVTSSLNLRFDVEKGRVVVRPQ